MFGVRNKTQIIKIDHNGLIRMDVKFVHVLNSCLLMLSTSDILELSYTLLYLITAITQTISAE